MNYKRVRSLARDRLKNNWGTSALIILIYCLLIGAVEGLAMWLPYGLGLAMDILGIVMAGPLAYGIASVFLALERGSRKPVVEDLFCGFNSKSRSSIISAGISIYVYTFLWSLLFVIPGIVASYSYSMTYYILLDNPEMNSKQAIEKSKQMMNGNKKDLFFLDLTFIGWILLGVISCGIGLLWVYPYIETSHAVFYDAIKAKFGQENDPQEPQTVVKNADEVSPFAGDDSVQGDEVPPVTGNDNISEIKTYKCYNCGAEEKSAEPISICTYCGGDMGEV